MVLLCTFTMLLGAGLEAAYILHYSQLRLKKRSEIAVISMAHHAT